MYEKIQGQILRLYRPNKIASPKQDRISLVPLSPVHPDNQSLVIIISLIDLSSKPSSTLISNRSMLVWLVIRSLSPEAWALLMNRSKRSCLKRSREVDGLLLLPSPLRSTQVCCNKWCTYFFCGQGLWRAEQQGLAQSRAIRSSSKLWLCWRVYSLCEQKQVKIVKIYCAASTVKRVRCKQHTKLFWIVSR